MPSDFPRHHRSTSPDRAEVLMVVLVTQLTFEDEERLRKTLNRKRFAGTPVEVEIRLLDFEALQRIYVTD